MVRADTARTALTALVVALALSVTGCSVVGPGEITGGQGGNEPGWNEQDGAPGETDGTEGGSNDDAESGRPGGANLPAVGTIEIKVDSGAASAPRLFTLDASECSVSAERIRVVGAGTEDGTGVSAEVVVDATLREVLHAGSGTYSAAGAITLSLGDGGTWVSDGRPSTIPGTTNLPSMFEYRVDEQYAEFRTSWFGSGGADTAGYVHVWCS